jgi:hypothetical protein
VILNPFNKLLLLALSISIIKTYSIVKKRNEDNGKPFLISLHRHKNLEAEPFIRITKEDESMQPIIELTTWPNSNPSKSRKV